MNYNDIDMYNEWVRGVNSGRNQIAEFAISMMELLDKNDTVQLIIDSLQEKIKSIDDGIIENKCDANSNKGNSSIL